MRGDCRLLDVSFFFLLECVMEGFFVRCCDASVMSFLFTVSMLLFFC